MQELVSSFRDDLKKRYGSSACQVEGLVRRFLSLWDKSRRAFYSQGKAVMVLPVGDPAHEWVDYVVQNVVLGYLQENNDERRSSSWGGEGFVFPWIAVPGADAGSVVRLCAEAMKRSSDRDWLLACAIAQEDYILEGCDPVERLERYLWSAMERINVELEEKFEYGEGPAGQVVTNVVREYVDELGGDEMVQIQSSIPRHDHLPVFVVTAGENLSDSGLYQMQHLAIKCGCRFLVVAASEEPESFQGEFCGGVVSDSIFGLLPYEPAIAGLDNVVAAVAEANHLIILMDEFCDSLRSEVLQEGVRIPFAVSGAVIDALRSGQDEG